MRYYFIRECVEECRIKLGYVATEKQVADVLTKSLWCVRFQELRSAVDVQAKGDRAKD
jgi:hypothetical protein